MMRFSCRVWKYTYDNQTIYNIYLFSKHIIIVFHFWSKVLVLIIEFHHFPFPLPTPVSLWCMCNTEKNKWTRRAVCVCLCTRKKRDERECWFICKHITLPKIRYTLWVFNRIRLYLWIEIFYFFVLISINFIRIFFPFNFWNERGKKNTHAFSVP